MLQKSVLYLYIYFQFTKNPDLSAPDSTFLPKVMKNSNFWAKNV